MAVLNEIEDRLPVDEWCIDDIAVWPLVRRDVAWGLDDAAALSMPRPRLAAVSHMARAGATALTTGLYVASRDRHRYGSPDGDVDVVMLGDTVSRTRVDGVWFDEFFDPVATALDAMGRSSTLLEVGRHIRVPRKRPAHSVQAHIDELKVRSMISLPARNAERLPGYDEFLGTMTSLGIAAGFDRTALGRRVRFVDLVARYFATILRPTVRLGMADIDGPVAMAFYLACRRTGVTSVEMQHGVQGDLHWGHGRWKCVPRDGYALLPAVFWTWSGYEADTISRWSQPVSSRHRPVVGGRPWLDVWLRGADPVVASYDEQVAVLQRRTGARVNVLVTLQTGVVTREWLQRLVAAAGATPSWFWWVRSRASMSPAEAEAVREAVRGMHNAETEQATALPLYALLRHVDAHVTAFSSVVIEAAAFGVPSVATDPDAATWFPNLVGSGWLTVASGAGNDLLGAVRDQMERAKRLQPVQTQLTASYADVLGALLDSAA
jgi:hypothetical protein